MRLRDMQILLDKYVPMINYEKVNDQNRDRVEVKRLQSSFDAAREIAVLGFLDDELERLKKHNSVYYFRTDSDITVLNNSQYNSINSIMDIIRHKCIAVQDTIHKVVPEKESNTVEIKLPNYTDIGDIESFFNKLNRALNKSMVLDNSNKENVKLKRFDSGSLWIEVIVFSYISLKFLNAVIQSILETQQKFLSNKKLKLEISKLQYDNESTEEKLIKQVNDSEEQLIRETIEQILTDNKEFKTSNEEEKRKLENVFKTILELINEGTEFYYQNEDEKNKNENICFPKAEAYQKIANEIKLLELK